MRTLTLTQPWATLVALGAKQYETRSWSTRYRGPLAIHAAKGFPGWAREVCYTQPFLDVLTAARIGPATFPLGKIVATAWLARVCSTDEPGLYAWLSKQELAFGDYGPGRYAWVLVNIEPLPEPVPAKGALGLWEWAA